MNKKGFTLVEVLVGTAVFVIIAIAAYNAYVSLFQLIALNQNKVLALDLANEQFEIARNMPYAVVGVVGGIPNGNIPRIQNLTRGGITFTVTTTVRNIDLPFDGIIGGTPSDLSPADNKLVQVEVSCDGCKNMQPITLVGQVAPKNLETASVNGALFIRVFDANGQPVQGASVHVVNVATSTTIVIDDVTDANGMLQLVDVPPGDNAYRIIVSKSGYSTDRTYPISDPSNPNPTKPDSTILLQRVTQVSFAIDRLSTIHFSAVSPTCEPASNFGFKMVGSKQIGENIPKYSENMTTNSSGIFDLNSMEWDSYNISSNDATRFLSGINPLNFVAVNPGGSQNIQMIVTPKEEKGLVVTVKDSTTQLPLSGATVRLYQGEESGRTLVTGQGYLSQTDWSSGSGEVDFSNKAKYFSDDGNIDVTTTAGQIRLRGAFDEYNQSGILESSTFDTGSISNFFSLIWSPIDQPILAGINSVRMQFATNATNTATTTWKFKGPDGTDASYYLASNSSLNSVHNADRYARYRVYLATDDETVSPNISDIAFTYTSNCVPSGQVIFTGLLARDYNIEVSKSGYSTNLTSVTIGSDLNWRETQILMGP